MRPASVDRWSTAIVVVLGGVLGMMMATAYHLLHDHTGLPSRDLLAHFIPQLISGCVGGALVLGSAAVVHNRKRQARRSDPRPWKPV